MKEFQVIIRQETLRQREGKKSSIGFHGLIRRVLIDGEFHSIFRRIQSDTRGETRIVRKHSGDSYGNLRDSAREDQGKK